MGKSGPVEAIITTLLLLLLLMTLLLMTMMVITAVVTLRYRSKRRINEEQRNTATEFTGEQP